MNRYLARIALALFALFTVMPAPRAEAAERLCDASFQDCRSPLITLIRNESVGIDVAFWFMEDLRYSTELIARWRAGGCRAPGCWGRSPLRSWTLLSLRA